MGAVVDIGTSGPLVGRDMELGVLGVASRGAAAGSVQVVAISGEGGIGKSRLAREGLRAAAAKGFRTLESAAGRLHRDLSYAPVVEALRPIVAEAALVEGLPDLARLFDELRGPPLVGLDDPGLERTRMFEAVRKLIERASLRLLLAILVDDLHWADPGTLALLHYVVRGLPRGRCLFLVTYRADEASDGLHELLTALERAEMLTRIKLSGLDPKGVADLTLALLQGPAPAALRDMLDRRSGGVPLYVKAIVLRLIETGALFRSGGRWVLAPGASAEMPALLSTLLRGKIEALKPIARGLLDVLAVCGGAADHVVVQDIIDDVAHGVIELRAADIVAEDIRGGDLEYRVVHPLLAEVAYHLLPVIVRRELHARLAAALERQRPHDLRLLAAHVRAAGELLDPAHALDVLRAATVADLARLAGEEARANAGAALDLARKLGRPEAVDELAGAYAQACELAGPVADASSAWVDAADTAADARARARRLTRGASVGWDVGQFAAASGLLDAADRALAHVGPCPERLELEEARMRFASRAGDLATLEGSIEQLAIIDRAIGSSRSRAAMVYAQVVLAYETGRYLDALGMADELISLARDQESPLVAEALLRPLSALRTCWGDLPGARDAVEEGLRLARKTGVPAVEIFQNGLLAITDVLAGDWQAALQRTSDDLDMAERVGLARGVIFALGTEAIVLIRFGRLKEAGDRVSEAERLFGPWSSADRHVFAVVDLAEGMLALAQRKLDHALEIAAGKAAHHPAIPPLALGLLGEAQAAAEDVTGARETASRLAALGPGAPYPAALAAWVSALAAGARRDPLSAVVALDELDQAIAGFAELGMPYEEAVARLDRAPVRHAAGFSADAVGSDVTAALEVLDRLEAKPQADRARALLRELGRRTGSQSRQRGQHRLSAREEEVARLVAQGLSNAEIAERLFITTRTVTTHLEHIYRRLEISSRSALIRYVLDRPPASEVMSRRGVDT
jgi:DNA-binding NarL/FixJ family response regulator/tetratricopeptide (TPR) repeat protein